MIKVDRSSVRPPDAWIERVSEARRRLAEFYHDTPFPGRVQRYAKYDQVVIRQIKPLLFELFKGKCAYCETPIVGDPGDVDNFRPKSGAIGLDRQKAPDHYWWLTYDWENLYLACRDCNFNKGSKFPIHGGRGQEEAPLSELRETEQPLLIDPCADDPDEHLAFGENGVVAPKTEKGRVTIEVLNLNRDRLRHARLKDSEDSVRMVSAIITAGDFTPKVLDELLAPSEPYAAAKRQVLHRFIREQVKTLEGSQGKLKVESALKLVEETSSFTSTAEQQSLNDDFRLTQLAQESAPIGGEAGDEFFFSKTQYITKIEIRNFRVIEEMTVEFPPPQEGKKPWLVLLGENGMGKSSVLKAVALALMGEQKHRELRLHPEKFLRRGTDEGHVEVHLTGYTKPFRLEFKSGEREFHTNSNQLHTLFFCYGGTRLLPSGRRRRAAAGDDYARINNLFDPFIPLVDAKSWLLDLDEDRFGFSARAVKQMLVHDEDHLLVRMPPERPRDVFLRREQTGDGDTLEALSDGYQSVIALAADLLEIMLKHYDEVKDSEGIVLIDEIDVHLHPRWKVQIVQLLREVFPRVQFLVTTHDPLCLLGALPGEVHVLRRHPTTGQVDARQVDVPPGTTADQVLTGFWFGLRSTLDDGTLELLDRHRQLLREKRPEEDPERRGLEATLRQRLGTFADTSVDRMAQSVAAEVIQESIGQMGPENRAAMHATISRRLLQMLRDKREKGGA